MTLTYQDRLGEMGERLNHRSGMLREGLADLMIASGIGTVEAASKPGATAGGAVGSGLGRRAGHVQADRKERKDEYQRLMERARELGIKIDNRLPVFWT